MLKKATPEEKAILRRVLAHCEKTSLEWYTRPDLTSTGIEAANIIQRLLASSAVDKEPNESSPSPPPGKDVAGPSTITEPDIHEEAESNGHDQQAQTCSPPPQITLSSSKTATYSKSPSKASTLASGIVPPSPPVKSLTEIQKSQINSTFKKEIENRVTITMEVAQKKMRFNPLLNNLSMSRARVKQVVNYVNHLVRKEQSTTKLPEAQLTTQMKVSDWLDDFDEPSPRSSSSRRTEWDHEDTQRLEKAYSKYHKMPSTATIRSIMDNDPQLSIIKEREGWNQLYNKIKNLFKKK